MAFEAKMLSGPKEAGQGLVAATLRSAAIVFLGAVFIGLANAQPNIDETPAALILEEGESVYNISEDPRGVVLKAGIWPENLGQLKVCWADRNTDHRAYRALVRSVVKNTIEDKTELEFAPQWPLCSDGYGPHIVINVREGQDTLKAEVGRQIDRPTEVFLDFDFFHWQRHVKRQAKLESWPFLDCAQPDNLEQCIMSTAFHEFGHVIGLKHEMTHPLTDSDCLQFMKETLCAGDDNDECVVTEAFDATVMEIVSPDKKYDPASFMNYCRKDRFELCSLGENGPECKMSKIDEFVLTELYCPNGGDATCRRYGE